MVYELYYHDDFENNRIIKHKSRKVPFVICVTKEKKYVVYYTRPVVHPKALEVTFFGYSRMTEHLSKIDYAKRRVRELYKQLKEKK